LRVEPPRLDPVDCDPEPPLGAGGADRTAGGGDDCVERGVVVRAGGALFVLVPVAREDPVEVDPLDSPLVVED